MLTIFLYKPLGVGGITLATSLVSTFNFFALMILLGPRIRRSGRAPGRLVGGYGPFIAFVPLCGVAYEVWWLLDRALGRSLWAQIVSVGLAYLAGGVAYCLAAGAMGMSELKRRGERGAAQAHSARDRDSHRLSGVDGWRVTGMGARLYDAAGRRGPCPHRPAGGALPHRRLLWCPRPACTGGLAGERREGRVGLGRDDLVAGEQIAALREGVGAAVGMPPQNVWICVTHTMSAPHICPRAHGQDPGRRAEEPSALAAVEAAAGAAAQAAEGLQRGSHRLRVRTL